MAIIEYLKCPLCNMNRPRTHNKIVNDGQGERQVVVTSDFQFYADTEVIQIREGGGRGSGFKKSDGGHVRIADLRNSEPQVYANLLEETRRLLAALEGH